MRNLNLFGLHFHRRLIYDGGTNFNKCITGRLLQAKRISGYFNRHIYWLHNPRLHDLASINPVRINDFDDCWHAGSTSGGLKLMRIIAFKVAMRELVRIAQPRKIKQIRMNGEVVEAQQMNKIVGMLFVWIGLFGICILQLF